MQPPVTNRKSKKNMKFGDNAAKRLVIEPISAQMKNNILGLNKSAILNIDISKPKKTNPSIVTILNIAKSKVDREYFNLN